MNKKSMYDLDTYIAEIYDQCETDMSDVDLIRNHLEEKSLNILEPFCGTGRISLSLLKDGHKVIGIDNAKGMLDWFKKKIINENIPFENVKLIEGDVLIDSWPKDVDLVILGCNCFYELASLDEQEHCIAMALKSLKPNGYLYVDNNHMEGDLDENWQELNVVRKSMCGSTRDGSIVETTRKTIWYDIKKRLAQFERVSKVKKNNGEILENTYIQQKHPVSKLEVQNMLLNNGFKILNVYGNGEGETYSNSSPRAIFWARKNLE